MRNAGGSAKPQRGMLGSRRVDNLRLHFTSQQQDDRLLTNGVHRVLREASGRLAFGDTVQGALLAQFCVDRRGLWLQVAHGMRGIHVNGRPVQRMALLRPGDSVYLDGIEIVVKASCRSADPVPQVAPEDAGDPRIVLRGVGGKHHGRSFPVGTPCEVGSAGSAGIRVDEEGFAPRHARLERRGDLVLLQSLDPAAESLVNGVPVRDALLGSGDQVVFQGRHRFVVEVPWASPAAEAQAHAPVAARVDESAAGSAPKGSRARRWPWLLLAALLLSALLSALLLLGPG